MSRRFAHVVGPSAIFILCLGGSLALAASQTPANEAAQTGEEPSDRDLEAAVERLERLLANDAGDAEAHEELASCYRSLNRLEEARAALNRAIELEPTRLSAYLSLAEILAELGDRKAAGNVLRRASLVEPNRAEPYTTAAKIQFRIGRIAAAEEAAQQAVTRDHRLTPEIHLLFSSIYRARGLEEKALEQLEAYLNEAPEAEAAARVRASLEEARRTLETTGAPSSSAAYWSLVQRYTEGDFFEASSALSSYSRTDLARALASSTALDDSRFVSAALLHTETALFAGGDRPFHFQKAIDYLGRVEDAERRRLLQRQWYLAMGYHYLGRRRYLVAVPFLNTAHQMFPRDIEISLALAAAREGAGRIDGFASEIEQAEVVLRQILEQKPDDAEAHLRLGHVLRLSGANEEAAGELQRALELDEGTELSAIAWLLLGGIQEEAGRLDEAIESHRAAARAAPNCQAIATALSHALHQAGRTEDAREVLVHFHGLAAREQDTWWRYLQAHGERFERMMQDLRREAGR